MNIPRCRADDRDDCEHCNEGLVCGECLRRDCLDHEGEDDEGWLRMAYCPRSCRQSMRVARKVAKLQHSSVYWQTVWQRLHARTTAQEQSK